MGKLTGKEVCIKWCSLCKCWFIKCPRCGNNSCNGGSGEDGKCPVCLIVYKLKDSISMKTSLLLTKLVEPDAKQKAKKRLKKIEEALL